jgi:hypothetical protein
MFHNTRLELILNPFVVEFSVEWKITSVELFCKSKLLKAGIGMFFPSVMNPDKELSILVFLYSIEANEVL